MTKQFYCHYVCFLSVQTLNRLTTLHKANPLKAFLCCKYQKSKGQLQYVLPMGPMFGYEDRAEFLTEAAKSWAYKFGLREDFCKVISSPSTPTRPVKSIRPSAISKEANFEFGASDTKQNIINSTHLDQE